MNVDQRCYDLAVYFCEDTAPVGKIQALAEALQETVERFCFDCVPLHNDTPFDKVLPGEYDMTGRKEADEPTTK
jgi:hypothetical protein